jgi:hypothetical protein
MTETDWLRLAALAMCGALILPAALRLPWRSRRILVFIAAWLAIFVAVSLAWRLAGE